MDAAEDDIAGQADDREDEDGGASGVREARPPLRHRHPHLPTEQERREHEVAHSPYRSWCPYCVQGCKKNRPHYRQQGHDDDGPSCHIDFYFLGGKDLDTEGEENRQIGNNIPCVVMKEKTTKMIFSYFTPGRGSEFDWPTEVLAKDVEFVGLAKEKVVFKGDQEKAITTFINKLKESCQQPIEERSQKFDKATNGMAERAVQQIEDRVRVMRLFLQDKLKCNIAIGHPIMAWLVPHCADLINKLDLGADGRSPYERLKGKKYSGELTEFATKVLYRVPRRHRGGTFEHDGKLDYGLGMTARATSMSSRQRVHTRLSSPTRFNAYLMNSVTT